MRNFRRKAAQVFIAKWRQKFDNFLSENEKKIVGLMGTHDEETWAYFNGTSVQCVLVSRAKEEGVLASEFVGTCYTHHQVYDHKKPIKVFSAMETRMAIPGN